MNAQGVVGVLWHDRRDNSDFGYWPRFAVSFDGGDTWTASVRVSERPMVAAMNGAIGFGFARTDNGSTTHELIFNVHNGANFKSGDTAGLMALGDSFQAFWIDNRTGSSQVWTSPIRVTGRVTAQVDVSESVEFRLTNLRFDEKSRVASADATLRNTSHGPLPADLTVVVTSLTSNATHDVAVVGASNGRDGVGATRRFTATPSTSGTLAPGMTMSRRLQFRLGPWDGASLNPLELQVKVLSSPP